MKKGIIERDQDLEEVPLAKGVALGLVMYKGKDRNEIITELKNQKIKVPFCCCDFFFVVPPPPPPAPIFGGIL